MGYLNFRGVSTATLNVYVAKFPSHKKPGMRHTEYNIPGRDGSVHVDEGYESFEIIAYLILKGVSAANRQVIDAWADGTGKLITSDDPSKCYMASVKKAVEWTRDEVGGVFYDTAKITFHCQPFMYESTDRIINVTTDQTIANLGNIVSRPLIKVYGNGDVDFTINGKQITIDDMQSAHPVTIDSETGYVYTDAGATSMTGDIPVFQLGNNTVAIGDNVTKLEINPRWGWV